MIRNSHSNSCFYIHGTVGVGKTLIMDLFYNHINETKKKRIHFHEFMIVTHDTLHKIRSTNASNEDNFFLIRSYAKDIKKDFDLICFDEFQVTNIADAMILGKLFLELFNLGVKIIITSNDKPQNLYKDGLQRELFLPFIELINNKSQVFNLNIDKDYREQTTGQEKVFFHPLTIENIEFISQLYRKLINGEAAKDLETEVKKRPFIIKRFANHIARFNFNELCGVALGAEDYLELIKHVNTLFLENVPSFTDENVDKQERFITLIDILYDNNIELVMSSEKRLNDFTSSRRLEAKFKRTCSRLNEMKSHEYKGRNQ